MSLWTELRTNTWPLATPPKAATHSLARPLSPTLPLVSVLITLSSLANISITPRPVAPSALVESNPTLALASPSMVMSSSKANSSFSTALAHRDWVLPPSQRKSFILRDLWQSMDNSHRRIRTLHSFVCVYHYTLFSYYLPRCSWEAHDFVSMQTDSLKMQKARD